jgi:nicotinamidase-related amidase
MSADNYALLVVDMQNGFDRRRDRRLRRREPARAAGAAAVAGAGAGLTASRLGFAGLLARSGQRDEPGQ